MVGSRERLCSSTIEKACESDQPKQESVDESVPESSTSIVNLDGEEENKTLGVVWIPKTDEIHNYNTRQSEFNFALPKPKTNFMKKSFAYRGAETWNNLSADIKSKTSISTFKNSLTASV